MFDKRNLTKRASLAALVLTSTVGILSACSTGVPAAQDLAGAAPQVQPSPSMRGVQDNPNGCYQFGEGTNLSHGWSCTFTGSASTITVPEDVTGMQLSLSGGEGGNSNPAAGGYGTAVTGTFTVTPGQTVTVFVGQGANDQTPGAGAANGGKPGGSTAGGGGGASSVSLDSTVVAVASGGGGGGAQGAFPSIDDGGAGGTSTENSGNGHGGSGPGSGDGHDGGNGPALADGTPGGGGHHGGGNGGGGGGGWGGGQGGGGGGWGAGGGAGGAAGGSYVSPTGQAPTMAQANRGGDGNVTITWI